ncbi:MAG: glycosyltransferase family 25 protein [bacterium]
MPDSPVLPEQCYVINLDRRIDRMAAFRAEQPLWTETFGLVPARMAAVCGLSLPGYGQKPWFRKRTREQRQRAWAGKAGCVLSHRAVIEAAQRNGARTVLIVEDDAHLTPEMSQQWKKITAVWVARLPEDWAAVYLCSHKPRQPIRLAENAGTLRLLEVSGASNTAAYLLNGTVLGALLHELPTARTIWPWVARHKAIDRWYAANLRRFGRVYACAPSVVLQQVIGGSDIRTSSAAVEVFDEAHRDVHLVRSRAGFQLRARLVQAQNRVLRSCSILRLLAKRLQGL